jgi:hypothetical protein
MVKALPRTGTMVEDVSLKLCPKAFQVSKSCRKMRYLASVLTMVRCHGLPTNVDPGAAVRTGNKLRSIGVISA